MLTTGTILQGRYLIEKQIGGGGMGVVYLASDNRLGNTRCAIKEMSPLQLVPADRTWAVAAFQQEAQLLAALSHPGLVRVIDYFDDTDNWYLVMDFVQGETLAGILRDHPEGLNSSIALEYALQLCDVLQYLHRQVPPVIFRDLKPSNAMVTPEGKIKLIDFGIARFFKSGQSHNTVNLGTPGYASPEHGGKGQTDARSDIYSLGVLLYEMLTGFDPTLSPFNLPQIRDRIPTISDRLAEAIERTLQIDPAKRWQTISDFRAELIECRSGSTQIRQPISVVVDAGLPSRDFELFSFELKRSLEQSAQRIFRTTQHDILVRNIVAQIQEKAPFQGKVLGLLGYAKVGTSEICREVSGAIKRRLHPVMSINLMPMLPHDGPQDKFETCNFVLRQILDALRRGQKMFDATIKRSIRRTHREQFPDGPRLSANLAGEIAASLISVLSLKVSLTAGDDNTAKKPSEEPQARLLRTITAIIDDLESHHSHVTLIFDEICTQQILVVLLEILRIFRRIPTLSSIVVLNMEDYHVWLREPHTKKLWADIVMEFYAPRIRNIAGALCDDMHDETVNSDSYATFMKSLEFHGRGLPGRVVDVLRTRGFYVSTRPGWKQRLRLERPKLAIQESQLNSIVAYADLQNIIAQNNQSMFVQETDRDSDRLALVVYATIDALLDLARSQTFLTRYRVRELFKENARGEPEFSSTKIDSLADQLLGSLVSSKKITQVNSEYYDVSPMIKCGPIRIRSERAAPTRKPHLNVGKRLATWLGPILFFLLATLLVVALANGQVSVSPTPSPSVRSTSNPVAPSLTPTPDVTTRPTRPATSTLRPTITSTTSAARLIGSKTTITATPLPTATPILPSCPAGTFWDQAMNRCRSTSFDSPIPIP